MDGPGAWTTFATEVGTCGIAWRDAVVTRFALPAPTAAALCASLGTAGVPAATSSVPAWVAAVVADVQALLAGTPTELASVPVDLSGLGATARAVYEAVRHIPPGATRTYGEVAATIGRPGGAQAVGAAMGHNPVPVIVPCHRVVGADGAMVGFTAHGGVALKRRLLELEGAAVVAQRRLF